MPETLRATCARVTADARAGATVITATVRLVVPSLCDWCVLYARSLHSGTARVYRTHPVDRRVFTGPSSLDSAAVQVRLGVLGAALSRSVLRTRDAVFGVDNSSVDSSETPGIDLRAVAEVMSVPVVHREHAFGVLTLVRAGRRPAFSDAEVDRARQICDVLALWLSRTDRRRLPREFQ